MIPASPVLRIGARLIELVVLFAIVTLTFGACAVASDAAPVSYTHLTLPTNREV